MAGIEPTPAGNHREENPEGSILAAHQVHPYAVFSLAPWIIFEALSDASCRDFVDRCA